MKSYEDRFFEEWKIMDVDADSAPFGLNEQLEIDSYLEAAIKRLEVKKTPENEAEIEQLQSQAIQIRQTLTQKTKNQVIRALAKFWAKSQKTGLDIFKEIFVNLAANLIQQKLLGM